jgi:hypothetical protein
LVRKSIFLRPSRDQGGNDWSAKRDLCAALATQDQVMSDAQKVTAHMLPQTPHNATKSIHLALQATL